MRLGENVQIDHMTVTRNGLTMKQFAGIEWFSEYVYGNMYSTANIANAHYRVPAIQVDGDIIQKISSRHAKN